MPFLCHGLTVRYEAIRNGPDDLKARMAPAAFEDYPLAPILNGQQPYVQACRQTLQHSLQHGHTFGRVQQAPFSPPGYNLKAMGCVVRSRAACVSVRSRCSMTAPLYVAKR